MRKYLDDADAQYLKENVPGIDIAAAFAQRINFGNGPLKLSCRVANCRLGYDNLYIVGASFIEIHRIQTPAKPRERR